MLQIRSLELQVSTSAGPMGATLRFEEGLNVLRANNTSGKSTCIQAILYALGLEGMLSASRAVPLPHVMTDQIEDPNDGTQHPVLDSRVLLEFMNGNGDVWTVQRWAHNPEIAPELVRVWFGPALTSPGAYDSKDFFVRRRGAAVRESGFHHQLAQFIGWDLPLVPRTDGRSVPLYMECLFPFLFVEQKRGWSGFHAQVPNYLRIPRAAERAFEFLLHLDAYDAAIRQQELEVQLTQLRGQWEAIVGAFQRRAQGLGVVVQGLEPSPPSSWPLPVEPALLVSEEGKWVPVDDELEARRAELADARTQPVRKTDDHSRQVSADLQRAVSRFQGLVSAAEELREESRLDEDEIRNTKKRLVALEEDIRRTKDVIVLRELGSVRELTVASGECPTCHQSLPKGRPLGADAPAILSVDENVKLLEEQRSLFSKMRDAATVALRAKNAKLAALRARADDAASEIRALRQTLTAASETPSTADVERRLRLERRIEELDDLLVSFAGLLENLGDVAEGWNVTQSELGIIRRGDVHQSDARKLSQLENAIRSQLEDYGFSSLPVDSIGFSADRYVPTHEGFELRFDLSASDMIRSIWAYLLGILEVARVTRTNHPGLLVLDEPRQQDADPVSFESLLRRASAARGASQQVIFATSEERERLEEMLVNTQHTLLHFDGKILRPL